jgi:hypothetical protein
MGGKLVALGLLGAGAWAANEYGYINFKQAAGNLPLPHLVSRLGGGGHGRELSCWVFSLFVGCICKG